MTRQEKLVSMLQPKEYKTKLKLYCVDCKAPNTLFDKVIPIKEENRLKQIKIEMIHGRE